MDIGGKRQEMGKVWLDNKVDDLLQVIEVWMILRDKMNDKGHYKFPSVYVIKNCIASHNFSTIFSYKKNCKNFVNVIYEIYVLDQ